MSSKSSFSVLVPSLVIALTLTACGGGSGQGSKSLISMAGDIGDTNTKVNPIPVESPTPVPISSATPSPTPEFPTCASSDPQHICIGVKFVSYEDGSGNTDLNVAATNTLFEGVNGVWATCNIAFQVEKYVSIDPTTVGLPYSPNWSSQTNAVRSKFSDTSTFLVATVGPWSGATIAVTMMPGSGIYGTIVGKGYSKNPLTVGHELGHYLGLYHVSDSSNLMSAYIGPDTKALTASQCSTARSTAQSSWPQMLRSL